jgi:hypothetical protein
MTGPRAMVADRVLWQQTEPFGADFVELQEVLGGWRISGIALFVHQGLPCRLEYAVLVDSLWSTRSVAVHGRTGESVVAVRIAVDESREWALNGKPCTTVSGCHDVDLSFTPATNVLPIRRLRLGVGESAPVRAAWLRFPELVLEPLDQTYLRTGPQSYLYATSSGFTAELQTRESGLPETYGSYWTAKA